MLPLAVLVFVDCAGIPPNIDELMDHETTGRADSTRAARWDLEMGCAWWS
jgi:hypothetical protein